MQAEEKGINIDSSQIPINEPSPHYKKYNSEGEISINSHEFHEKSESNLAGNTLNQDQWKIKSHILARNQVLSIMKRGNIRIITSMKR
jgi:catalase